MLTKRRMITGAAVVLLMALGGGLYGYWTKTPLYSLWQAKRAFQQHHLIAFEKYVDIENMTGRMIDQMTAANSKAAQKSGNLWDQLVQRTAQGLVPMVKPQLVKRLKEQLEAYVEKGQFEVVKNDSGHEFFTLQHLYQMAGGKNVELRGIAFVKTEHSMAIVGLTLQHKVYHVPMLLELKMLDREGYWQVAEFNNLPEYMKNLGELEAKHGGDAGKP